MCFKFHGCFGIGHGDEDYGHAPPTPRRPPVAARGPTSYHQPQPARAAANGYNGGYHGNGNGYKHAAAVDETGRKANNDIARKDHAAAAAAMVADGHGRVATYAQEKPYTYYAAADETAHRLPAAAARNNKVADHRGTAARFHGPATADHGDAMDHQYYPTTNFGR